MSIFNGICVIMTCSAVMNDYLFLWLSNNFHRCLNSSKIHLSDSKIIYVISNCLREWNQPHLLKWGCITLNTPYYFLVILWTFLPHNRIIYTDVFREQRLIQRDKQKRYRYAGSTGHSICHHQCNWSSIDQRWKLTCNFCFLDSNFSWTTSLSSLDQPISCWFACWCSRIPCLSHWRNSNTGTRRKCQIFLVTIFSLCVLCVSSFLGSYLSWTCLRSVLATSPSRIKPSNLCLQYRYRLVHRAYLWSTAFVITAFQGSESGLRFSVH